MRLSFLAWAPPVAMVLVVFACSSTTVREVHTNPDVPEGGMELEDGAIVGPDGEIVTPDSSPKPSLVNVTTDNIDGFGTRPPYVLAVPKTYSATKSYPLILVFHGDGGEGAGMRAFHTLDDVTGNDAIVVYPSGKGHTWDLSTTFADNDDQKYVEALISALKGNYNVDAGHVFGVGYSSGAFLVNQLSCRRSGIFRGIAVHEGGAPFEIPEQKDADGYQLCPNQPKVAAFITHGTSDGTVLPESGDFDAKFWAHYNGCDPDNRVDTTPTQCKKHASCPASQPVEFCLVPGLGHVVWDQAAVLEWAFFKAL